MPGAAPPSTPACLSCEASSPTLKDLMPKARRRAVMALRDAHRQGLLEGDGAALAEQVRGIIQRESEMANISDYKRKRIHELKAAGQKPNWIANNLQLSVAAVEAELRLHPNGPVAAREPLATSPPAARREAPQRGHVHWQQKDWDDFVEFWQGTPDVERAAEAYNLTPKQVKAVCGVLKRNGVALRRARRGAIAGIDFDALRKKAESLLDDKELAAIQKMREHGRKTAGRAGKKGAVAA